MGWFAAVVVSVSVKRKTLVGASLVKPLFDALMSRAPSAVSLILSCKVPAEFVVENLILPDTYVALTESHNPTIVAAVLNSRLSLSTPLKEIPPKFSSDTTEESVPIVEFPLFEKIIWEPFAFVVFHW